MDIKSESIPRVAEILTGVERSERVSERASKEQLLRLGVYGERFSQGGGVAMEKHVAV